MRIQHNIPALNTYRQMGVNNTGTAKALEKLSSGYKINKAGDDAAGLAISEKMRAQVRGLNRASSNAQDGISLIQAAEGALQETHSVLQRMRELSVQASSDVNETIDRQAIQDEMNQLKTEVDRIANTTEFNKKTILNGSLQDGAFATKMLSGTAVLAGAHVDQTLASMALANGDEVADVYTIAVTQQAVKATDTYTFDLTDMIEGDTMQMELDFDNSSSIPGGQLVDATPVFTYTATGNASVDNAAFINGLKEALQKVVKDYEVTSTGNSITFTANDFGAGYANVSLSTANVSNNNPNAAAAGYPRDDGNLLDSVAGDDATVEISSSKQGASIVSLSTDNSNGEYSNGIFTDNQATGLVFQVADLTKLDTAILQVNSGRELTIQAGANTGKDQTIGISIGTISAAGLGIDNLDVSTHIAGQASLASVENAITLVSTQRAELGAVQNRLEHTISNLDTVSENLQDAESRIRDVDMAKEMMNFTKFNILNQASQAMMAQANNLPQGVLQLLR